MKLTHKIVPRRADCSAFGTGYCWSCDNPYWTGHYPTRKEAVAAATKKRRQMLTDAAARAVLLDEKKKIT